MGRTCVIVNATLTMVGSDPHQVESLDPNMAILLLTLGREVTVRELYIPHILIGVNHDCTGRIAKWSTVLGAFDIKYMPRTSVKG